MSETRIKTVDYPDARLIGTNVRISVGIDPSPIKTEGKAFLLEEKHSFQTNDKISSLGVRTKSNNHFVLDIVHGKDESVDNLFKRMSRYQTMESVGTILTISPLLVWTLCFYFWVIVWEQVIKKRFAYFTTTTVVIHSLLFLLAMSVMLIIILLFSREDIRVSNFAVTGIHKRIVAYYFEGDLDPYEAVVYEGFLWHSGYSSSRLFNLKWLGSILGKEAQKRRKLLLSVREAYRQYLKSLRELDEIGSKIGALQALQEARKAKGKSDQNLLSQLKELKETEKSLREKSDKLAEALDDKIEETDEKIKQLNSEAIGHWKTEMEQLGKEQVLKIETKQILRQAERIQDLEHLLTQSQISVVQLSEQISAMLALSIASTDAIKDVSLTGSEDASARIRLAEERRRKEQLTSKPINWNPILRNIGTWVGFGLLAIAFVWFVDTVKEIDKLKAIIWLFGAVLLVAALGGIVSMFLNEFRVKQPDRVEVREK